MFLFKFNVTVKRKPCSHCSLLIKVIPRVLCSSSSSTPNVYGSSFARHPSAGSFSGISVTAENKTAALS